MRGSVVSDPNASRDLGETLRGVKTSTACGCCARVVPTLRPLGHDHPQAQTVTLLLSGSFPSSQPLCLSMQRLTASQTPRVSIVRARVPLHLPSGAQHAVSRSVVRLASPRIVPAAAPSESRLLLMRKRGVTHSLSVVFRLRAAATRGLIPPSLTIW